MVNSLRHIIRPFCRKNLQRFEWGGGENCGAGRIARLTGLLVVFFNCYGFEVFGFEDLAAIQALQVFHPIAPGDDLGTVVIAWVLHKARLRIYSNDPEGLVKGFLVYFMEF